MTEIKYTVNPSDVTVLVERLEKLAKRARKLECAALTWTVGAQYVSLDPDTHENRCYVDVVVAGALPRYQGWAFVASIERYGDELLVTTAPGETVPADFDRTATAQTCDHCRASRDRKQTYLLRHDDDRTVRVGSTCLKDFLGHNFPSGVARLLREYGELDSFVDELGGGAWCADLAEFLAVAARHCRADGYVSRTTAEEQLLCSTADATLAWFDAKTKGRRVEQPAEQDADTASRALQWAQTVEPDSDYLHNIGVVARAGFVTFCSAGIAASILRAAELAAEREARDTTAANLAETSAHFGTVGERGTWRVTVLSCFATEGQYGTTWIYKFVTADGNAAVWFSSRRADVEVGEIYWLTGTIKKHDWYRGTDETHVTRCKLSTDEPPKPRRRKAKPTPKRNQNVEAGENVTIEQEGDRVWVWGHSTYGDSSVLAGQCRRRRIECFETIEKARAEYPGATVCDGAMSAWANRENMYGFSRSVQPSWFDPADAGESW